MGGRNLILYKIGFLARACNWRYTYEYLYACICVGIGVQLFIYCIYGSRSKVLNKKFNLGGTQPTLLYDFTSSLCGVTQGNPAKHKLGARLAQGWRKCFHVLS